MILSNFLMSNHLQMATITIIEEIERKGTHAEKQFPKEESYRCF